MDRLESLTNTLSQVTMYDIKSMYNQVRIDSRNTLLVIGSDARWIPRLQAKNIVLNVSEMEAKVREATNDDPWCVVVIGGDPVSVPPAHSNVSCAQTGERARRSCKKSLKGKLSDLACDKALLTLVIRLSTFNLYVHVGLGNAAAWPRRPLCLHFVLSQQFNEIMPCIYSRFMEKEASQWRQIYKVRSIGIVLPGGP